jgi:hypothetical protein
MAFSFPGSAGLLTDSHSALSTAIFGGMPRPPKKPTAAKLRNWRVAIMRSRPQQIGTVAAPDRQAAEAEAVKAFRLDEDQRKRLLILERG